MPGDGSERPLYLGKPRSRGGMTAAGYFRLRNDA